ncbi:MAG: PerC family transcriptional regulator [Rouxiella aceris]|uniref:PerC family transcriptional regulator n=1 Tax=Rouxiella aceris TaxID=2703884 RepID=UPI00284EEB3A|nr:PerC family transcriptional regulator [Rouxiella aceris]MDR3430737.1 PerC family transcriptional regulator [Rouxiella aceris]
MTIKDNTAEMLEERGWWHRAARRWLDVLDLTIDDLSREAIVRRRDHCLNMSGQRAPDQRRREYRKRYKQQIRYRDGY